jgi:acetoin:2,6-dichlorophenolindophenol oxidoreductase subunit beta
VREITLAEAVREALREEMRKNADVILIGQEIGTGYEGIFGVTTGLMKEFGPRQVIDTPIMENTMLGCGIGAALLGMKPVVEMMFSDFASVCFDGIVNQAAKIGYMSGDQYALSLVIRMPGGGGYGMGPHHSQCLESLFMTVPGLSLVAPSNGYDAKGLMKTCINLGRPVLFFENRKLYKMKFPVPEEEYTLPLGKGNIVRAGTDLTLIAVSYMVRIAEKVAEELKKNKGVEVEVIDPRTIVPLDEEIIAASIKKTGRVAILEEGHLRGSVGSEISSVIAEKYMDWLDHPIQRIGAKNVPVPASIALENAVLPGKDSVYQDIVNFFSL